MTGGWTPFSAISAGASQDAQVVKPGPGLLGWYLVTNSSAADRYVRVYDKATAPASTDTPALRFYVPPKGGVAGLIDAASPDELKGIGFTNGIGIRITTGPADNDAGNAGANDVFVNFGVA